MIQTREYYSYKKASVILTDALSAVAISNSQRTKIVDKIQKTKNIKIMFEYLYNENILPLLYQAIDNKIINSLMKAGMKDEVFIKDLFTILMINNKYHEVSHLYSIILYDLYNMYNANTIHLQQGLLQQLDMIAKDIYSCKPIVNP